MRVAEVILRADSAVTDDLAGGANSVRTIRERQGEQVPYIVVDRDLVNPNDTQQGQPMQEWEFRVNIVSDIAYTDGAKIGAWNIGENVKSALHGASGTYDNVVVADVVFDRQTHQLFNSTNEVRVQVEQVYTVYIRYNITGTSNVSALLLTQAEYDALGTYDDNTYYLISDA